MKSENFEILRRKWPELAELGGFAEAYAHADPASALVKLRLYAENVTKDLYRDLSGSGGRSARSPPPRRRQRRRSTAAAWLPADAGRRIWKSRHLSTSYFVKKQIIIDAVSERQLS